MSATELLLWMSARGQGTWQQFRSAVEELHMEWEAGDERDEDAEPSPLSLPLYQELRLGLQRFGHAEFFAGCADADWRVCPPSLALRELDDGWTGVLCGARSDKLLERLHNPVGGVTVATRPLAGCPDRIQVSGSGSGVLSGFAAQVGLLLQRNAPHAILAALPPIDSPTVLRRAEFPLGREWVVERFSASRLAWRACTRDEATAGRDGLFRFTLRYQRYVLLATNRSVFHVPGQLGKYVMLRRGRIKVIEYHASTLRLSVPSSCRPPFLIERALIACSGLPPTFQRDLDGRGVLHYEGVPVPIAYLAAGLLRQEMR